jgi:hypothetical protein
MYRSSLLLTAALIGTNIALVQTVADAKSATEVGEAATAITLEIKSNNSSKVGSGILLQRQGDVYTVLTVAHVVTSGNSFKVKTPDGQIYQSLPNSLRRAGKNIDLAVFRFRSPQNYPIAKIGSSNTMRVGSSTYVAGFPTPTYVAAAGTMNFTEGKVIGKASRANQDGYGLLYSNITLPGMSGGPVLNEAGELVAIHGQGDRVGKEGSGEKTGRNLGITIEKFGTVSQAMGVQLDQRVATVPTTNQAPNGADFLLSAFDKYDRGDIRGAAADYRRSLSLDPQLIEAYDSDGFFRSTLNGVLGTLGDLIPNFP